MEAIMESTRVNTRNQCFLSMGKLLLQTPVRALLELCLKVGAPLAYGFSTRPVHVMIRRALTHILSTPTGLGGIFRVVKAAIRADQIQEGR